MLTRLLVFVACLWIVPTATQAQHISFSFGHAHGHHHHHCWDDPFWCGPHWGYAYVYPPPVVRREVTYVQPVERVVETRVEVPRVKSAPRSTTASNSVAAAPLQIWNSAGHQVPVAFLADGQQVALSDGQSHTFYGGGARLVEFDRGGDFGTARVELSSGQYEFVITGRGWDLVPRSRGASPLAIRPLAPRNELPADKSLR
jgi:hypothetical protein